MADYNTNETETQIQTLESQMFTAPKELVFSPEVFRNLKKIRIGKEFQMILADANVEGAVDGDRFVLKKRDSNISIQATYKRLATDKNLPETHSRVVFTRS